MQEMIWQAWDDDQQKDYDLPAYPPPPGESVRMISYNPYGSML